MQGRPQQQPMAESDDILNADNNPLMRKAAAKAGQRPIKDHIFFATKPIETTEDLLNPEHNPLNRKRSLLEVPKDVINLLAEKHLPDLADRNALARTCKYFHAATQETLNAKKTKWAEPKRRCLLLLDRKILSDSGKWASSALRMSRFTAFNPFHRQNDTSQFYKDIKRGIDSYSSFDDVLELIYKLDKYMRQKVSAAIYAPFAGSCDVDYALICLLREIMITQFPEEYSAACFAVKNEISELQKEREIRFLQRRSAASIYGILRERVNQSMLLGCFDYELVRNVYDARFIPICEVNAAALKVQAFYQDDKRPVHIDQYVPLKLQSIYPAIFIHDTYGETNASFNKAANEAAKERLGSAAKSRQPGL